MVNIQTDVVALTHLHNQGTNTLRIIGSQLNIYCTQYIQVNFCLCGYMYTYMSFIDNSYIPVNITRVCVCVCVCGKQIKHSQIKVKSRQEDYLQKA